MTDTEVLGLDSSPEKIRARLALMAAESNFLRSLLRLIERRNKALSKVRRDERNRRPEVAYAS